MYNVCTFSTNSTIPMCSHLHNEYNIPDSVIMFLPKIKMRLPLAVFFPLSLRSLHVMSFCHLPPHCALTPFYKSKRSLVYWYFVSTFIAHIMKDESVQMVPLHIPCHEGSHWSIRIGWIRLPYVIVTIFATLFFRYLTTTIIFDWLSLVRTHSIRKCTQHWLMM